MHSTTTSRGGAIWPVLFITLAFAALGSMAPRFLAEAEPFLVLGMMLLLGLPHGATDHGLFLALKGEDGRESNGKFYLAYLGGILAYGLVWYFLPLAAFFLFILLSVYHFGQSNWVNVKYDSAVLARLHYLIWGVGILMTPILLHAEEAIRIVGSMTEVIIPSPTPEFVSYFIVAFAVLNVAAVLTLYVFQKINVRRFLLELLAYALLLVMFLSNSLLLGFTVYFVFWHSLSSAQDQMLFFDRRLSAPMRQRLFVHIGATVCGALIFCLVVWLGPGPSAALQPSVIGKVFIAISLLTLPHMVLVERLYAVWSPLDEVPAVPKASKTTLKINVNTSPQSAADRPIGERLTITH